MTIILWSFGCWEGKVGEKTGMIRSGVGHHWMEGTESNLTVPTFGIHMGYSVCVKIPRVRRD